MKQLSINWLDSLGKAPAPVAQTRMGLDFADELVASREVGPMDPNPDYDVSDEIEYFFRYLTWGLRGVEDGHGYPPPAYPPV
jgi:hypothetical protein